MGCFGRNEVRQDEFLAKHPRNPFRSGGTHDFWGILGDLERGLWATVVLDHFDIETTLVQGATFEKEFEKIYRPKFERLTFEFRTLKDSKISLYDLKRNFGG